MQKFFPWFRFSVVSLRFSLLPLASMDKSELSKENLCVSGKDLGFK